MALRSISQKVVQVEKRQLEEQRTAPFSTFAVFAFWFTAALGALMLATVSFYSVDFKKKLADESLKIDRTTTASINNRPINRQSPETKQRMVNQERLINNMRNIIGRLRAEQASLNERIAEMENQQRTVREEVKALKEKKSAPTTTTEKKAQIITPGTTIVAKSPERTEPQPRPSVPSKDIVPKSVATKSIANDAEPPQSIVKPAPKPALQAKSEKVAIDNTAVGSIKRIETLKFGIDLGVNPTQSRAKKLWADIGKAKPTIGQKLQAIYLDTGNAEGETRLIAGPYSDAGDAIKACVELRTLDTFCKTTIFPE